VERHSHAVVEYNRAAGNVVVEIERLRRVAFADDDE
jgi:hypothetical protein